jgi:hypothetical protein
MFSDLLAAYWIDEEFHGLCLHLGVDYDDLTPPFLRRISDLIDHMRNRGRLLQLLDVMIKERPFLAEA